MKMRGLKYLLGALMVGGAMTMTAHAADKVIIGTFGESLPVQMAAHEGKLAEATGWNIDWRKFASGTDVIAAMASGDVALADRVHVGAGATIIQGVTVGTGAIIAAGTVITENVEPLTLVAGVPGKVKRELTI